MIVHKGIRFHKLATKKTQSVSGAVKHIACNTGFPFFVLCQYISSIDRMNLSVSLCGFGLQYYREKKWKPYLTLTE